ncbi:unnamed protein product [Brassicogethes aeneus]|uniref:Dipeptidase n=1 Tax=Brassicogethes aeneus TaxID=1431903 RepID=A0A9P0AZ56_BRAAE|nr:unnamed protein product [Brassicogethes aeneus]
MWKNVVIVFIIFFTHSFCAKVDFPGRAVLDNFPLIDGHNDLPWNIFLNAKNHLEKCKIEADLTKDELFGSKNCVSCVTDLPRLKKGKLGAQFWAAYVDCTKSKDPVLDTLEQIDVIKRMVRKYPNDLKFTTTADGILEAFKEKKIASLIGVEGGHSIDNHLSVLRAFYDLGVRYLTLTHTCNLDWADSSLVDDPKSTHKKGNLNDFGKKIVLEMNRLGMLVDLSHVSKNIMWDVLNVTRSPIIFSHSSAKAIYSHSRNVDDDVLLKVKLNGGIVMVNFFSQFISRGNATIKDVTDHINHIADIAGIDHVGIGSDFDGVPSYPKGLEDTSKYPDLFDLLREQNKTKWTVENLEKLAGRNFIRVFKTNEKIRDDLTKEEPVENP